ncbi:MAG: hypothetical protein WBA45_02540 [Microthrixaceae bacterium]
MTTRSKHLVLAVGLITFAIAVSGCELSLPAVDCSWINQADMGGLVCLGQSMLTLIASLLALVGVVALGLGSVVPT